MFRPLECFIGLRYLRPRRRRGLASFMTMASLIGIALGVAALIIILSVMNGFEAELRTRLLSMGAHASVASPSGGLSSWRDLAQRVETMDGVAGVAPYVEFEGMLAAGANLRPAIVRGVLPAEETTMADTVAFLNPGGLARLEPGQGGIILGRALALNLGVDVGGRLNLLIPRIENERPVPRLTGFTVVGTFEAGIQDHDANLALIHLHDASALRGLDGQPQGLGVRLEDAMSAPRFSAAVEATLGSAYRYSDWTEENRNYFQAIRIEKTMMTVLLMFIIAVAAFNIVASLMMVVVDKEKDIAILRTYGLEPERVARIFFVQGATIGVAGTAFGVVAGLLCALNVDTIVPWLERTFNFQIMPGDVYYVTQIPSEIHLWDVVLIPGMALLVAILATVYPSRRAARIAPAQALRYE